MRSKRIQEILHPNFPDSRVAITDNLNKQFTVLICFSSTYDHKSSVSSQNEVSIISHNCMSKQTAKCKHNFVCFVLHLTFQPVAQSMKYDLWTEFFFKTVKLYENLSSNHRCFFWLPV